MTFSAGFRTRSSWERSQHHACHARSHDSHGGGPGSCHPGAQQQPLGAFGSADGANPGGKSGAGRFLGLGFDGLSLASDCMYYKYNLNAL